MEAALEAAIRAQFTSPGSISISGDAPAAVDPARAFKKKLKQRRNKIYGPLKAANKPGRVLAALCTLQGRLLADELGKDQDQALKDIDLCIALARQLKKLTSRAQLNEVVRGSGAFLKAMRQTRLFSTRQACRGVARVIGRLTLQFAEPLDGVDVDYSVDAPAVGHAE